MNYTPLLFNGVAKNLQVLVNFGTFCTKAVFHVYCLQPSVSIQQQCHKIQM